MMKQNGYRPAPGKYKEFRVRTANIKGFAVLELSHLEHDYVGLAFCSPRDRLKGKWDRLRGADIAFERFHDPAHRLPHNPDWPVQRVVMYAVVLERQKVPWEIADALMAVLTDEKASKGPKPVWSPDGLWERPC